MLMVALAKVLLSVSAMVKPESMMDRIGYALSAST